MKFPRWAECKDQELPRAELKSNGKQRREYLRCNIHLLLGIFTFKQVFNATINTILCKFINKSAFKRCLFVWFIWKQHKPKTCAHVLIFPLTEQFSHQSSSPCVMVCAFLHTSSDVLRYALQSCNVQRPQKSAKCSHGGGDFWRWLDLFDWHLKLLFSFFPSLLKIYTSVETLIQSLSTVSPGHPDSVAPLLPSTELKGKSLTPSFNVETTVVNQLNEQC